MIRNHILRNMYCNHPFLKNTYSPIHNHPILKIDHDDYNWLNLQCIKTGVTPLMRSVQAGDVDGVKFHLEHHSDFTLLNFENQTAYDIAIKCQYSEIANLLKEHASLQDTTGNTLLHYAAAYGRFDLVKILVKMGLNIYDKNNEGKSSYDLANENDYTNLFIVNKN